MNNTAMLMADYIRAAGVGQVFGYPGDPIIEFMEAARKRELDIVLARREGSAAFMAEAYGMATGRLGVCLSTLGPGSTALVNGVAAANLDRVAMLALSGQIETSREQFFTHQVVDHKLLFSPITKWAGRIEPSAAATILRKAMRLATAERPGAVHLSCSADAAKAEVADSTVLLPPLGDHVASISVHRASASSPDPLTLLKGSRRPVLLAGIAATRCNATDALVRLSETAGIPVVVAPMAKGVFPETHPNFVGVLDMAVNHVLWEFLGDSDLIITAGFDPVELIKPWQLSTPVLHIDTIANIDQVYYSECEVVGDVAAALDWLSDEWVGEPRWDTATIARSRSRVVTAYYEGRTNGRLNPTDVVDEVRAAMPDDAIATCDVGSHKLLVGQGWTTHAARGVLMTNGLSSMGFGVPAAIAAQIAFPDRRVVALVGDGGFAMTATEMRLAAELRLPIVVVVFVDGSLNRIELKQQALQIPSTATRIEMMDLVGLAEAMMCDGVRVDTSEQLAKCLADAGTLSRPLIVEARIDPAQYSAQF